MGDEKIEELAREACLKHQPSFDALTQYGSYSHSQYNLAIEKLMLVFAESIINECIEEIDSFEIIDRNGTPVEQVADALMRVKCNIREKFETKTAPTQKICNSKINGVCSLHNLFCAYPNCEK